MKGGSNRFAKFIESHNDGNMFLIDDAAFKMSFKIINGKCVAIVGQLGKKSRCIMSDYYIEGGKQFDVNLNDAANFAGISADFPDKKFAVYMRRQLIDIIAEQALYSAETFAKFAPKIAAYAILAQANISPTIREFLEFIDSESPAIIGGGINENLWGVGIDWRDINILRAKHTEGPCNLAGIAWKIAAKKYNNQRN